MKTPDKIKKGLAVCATLDGDCENCPYDDGKQLACVDRSRRDALAYIIQLESRLAQVERERDAAIADLKLYAGCKVCKHGDFKFPKECMDCGDETNYWQWRGVCEENTHDQP